MVSPCTFARVQRGGERAGRVVPVGAKAITLASIGS